MEDKPICIVHDRHKYILHKWNHTTHIVYNLLFFFNVIIYFEDLPHIFYSFSKQHSILYEGSVNYGLKAKFSLLSVFVIKVLLGLSFHLAMMGIEYLQQRPMACKG